MSNKSHLNKQLATIIAIFSFIIAIFIQLSKIYLPYLTQNIMISVILTILYMIFYLSLKKTLQYLDIESIRINRTKLVDIFKGWIYGILVTLLFPIILTILNLSSSSLTFIGLTRILNILLFMIIQAISFKIFGGLILEYAKINKARMEILNSKKIQSQKKHIKLDLQLNEFDQYLRAKEEQISERKRTTDLKNTLLLSAIWVGPLLFTILNTLSIAFIMYYFLIVFSILSLTERNGYNFGMGVIISASLFIAVLS